MRARIQALALPLAGSLDTSYNLSEPCSFMFVESSYKLRSRCRKTRITSPPLMRA